MKTAIPLFLAFSWLLTPEVLAANDSIGALPTPEVKPPELMLETAMKGVVAIRTETQTGASSGSGFVIDSQGTILTNLHVIEGAERVTVKTKSGEQFSNVRVVAYDRTRDLAIIKIPSFGLSKIELANSDTVKIGSTVYSLGSPLGLEETVSRGIVSGIRVMSNGVRVIQTDSAVSPGNSGGPLVNSKGQAIGVVTFKFVEGDSLNFAIPANYASALLSFEKPRTLKELNSELSQDKGSLFTSNGNPEISFTQGSVIVVATPNYFWAAEDVASVLGSPAKPMDISLQEAFQIAAREQSVVGVVDVELNLFQAYETVFARCYSPEKKELWRKKRLLNFGGGPDRLARDMVGALLRKVKNKTCP